MIFRTDRQDSLTRVQPKSGQPKHRECICALCESERSVIEAVREFAKSEDRKPGLYISKILDALAALERAEKK